MKSITGDGSEGIRALNEEELDWLNKFYGEYINNSFKRDGTDLMTQSEEELEYIQGLRDQISEYRLQVKSNKMSKEDWFEYNRLKDELFEVDNFKNCSDRNNQRNRCLYNETKKRGKMTKRTMAELDQNTIEKLGDSDMEFMVAMNSHLLWGDD